MTVAHTPLAVTTLAYWRAATATRRASNAEIRQFALKTLHMTARKGMTERLQCAAGTHLVSVGCGDVLLMPVAGERRAP